MDEKKNETRKEDPEDVEVAELEDRDLEEASGGALGNFNCGC